MCIEQYKLELKCLISNYLKENDNLKTFEEACLYYLKGYKVRRYITPDIIELEEKIKPLRSKYNKCWDDCWVYNDSFGKKLTNEKYNIDDMLSPLESFDKHKNDWHREYKIWEINNTKGE